MAKLRLLFGVFLAGSLDISFGIFSSMIVSYYFGQPLTLLTLAIGVFFAVFPDLDLILVLLRKCVDFFKVSENEQKNSIAMFVSRMIYATVSLILEIFTAGGSSGEHKQSIMHYPIFLLGICFAIIIFDKFWGVLSFLCFFAHIAHDLLEGTGIAVFAPKYLKHYVLHKKDGKWKIKLSDHDLMEMYEMDMVTWVERDYLTFNLKPVINLAAFTIAVVMAISMLV